MSRTANAPQEDSDLLTALMERIREDDPDAFHELFRAFRSRLEQFIHQRINDWACAEDLAQQTFVRIYLARHRYRPTARFTTWAFTIAVNLTKNERRRRARKHLRALQDIWQMDIDSADVFRSEEDSAEETVIHRETVTRVRERLELLPHRQQTALEMFAIRDEPMAAIQESLDCSCNAVKGLLSRARDEMRQALPELANSRS